MSLLGRRAVLLVLLPPTLLLVATACGGSSGSAQATDTQVDTVRRGNLLIAVPATGNVSLPKQAKLTFPASGTVTEVLASWGQEVREGQELARMDPSGLNASALDADLSVLKARKALADYVDTFSADQVTKARNTVATANTSVLQAQKSLDSYRDTFTPLGIIKAENAVLSAHVGIAQADKTHKDYLDSFSQGNVNKLRTALENVRLSVQNAQDALLRVPQDGPGNPVYDTRNRVSAAEIDLRNARTALDAVNYDFSVALLDWAMRQGVQERLITAAETAYQTQMNARHRIALNTPELLLRSPDSFLPADTTVATTIQDAWFALTDQRTNLAILRIQKDKAIAAAKSNVAKAEDTVKAASRARDEAALAHQNALAGDAARLRAGELAVEQAKVALADAQTNLTKALAGPDPVQVSILLAAVDSAKVRLQDTQKALDDARKGPEQRELTILQVNIDSARQRVAEAETALAKLVAGPDRVDRASLENAIASAELRFKQAKDNLERAVLKAPFGGVVSAVGVAAGDTVGAATVAITLVDTRSAEVTTSVDEIDLPKLKLGQTVTLTSDSSPGLRVIGTVKAIAPIATVQQGVVSYSVLLGVQGPGVASLRGGMTLNAQIVVENKQGVLLVPLRAVQTSGQNRVVNVTEGGVSTPKTVRVGSSNSQFVEILEGLDEGAQIVVPTRTSYPQQQQLRFPAGGGFPGGGGAIPIGGGGGGGGGPRPGR